MKPSTRQIVSLALVTAVTSGLAALPAGAVVTRATAPAAVAAPADWTVSAPASLVDPVGQQVAFTVTVTNPDAATTGQFVFALVGQLPQAPGPVEATLDLWTGSAWVPLQIEGAAGTHYYTTGTVAFATGSNAFRFRIGHRVDAQPNRIEMRTYAEVDGSITPEAHTTVYVPGIPLP